MKHVFRAIIIVTLIMVTIRPSAGQLTINGNVGVTSNLSARTISVVGAFGQVVCTLGGAGSTLSSALAIQYGSGSLQARMYGADTGWLQAYGSTGSPTYLGLNSNGGQVGIGTWDTIDDDGEATTGLTVGPSTRFETDVEVDGKLNLEGGMDPPYLLLDSETRSNIANRVAREVPPSKQTGAALFWNSQTKQLEVYVANEGSFYDLTGNLLVAMNVSAPTNTTVVTGYRIDPATGNVVQRQTMHTPRWQVKSGYRFNSLTGVFTQMGSDTNAAPDAVSAPTGVSTQVGSDSNATPVVVSAQEALELK